MPTATKRPGEPQDPLRPSKKGKKAAFPPARTAAPSTTEPAQPVNAEASSSKPRPQPTHRRLAPPKPKSDSAVSNRPSGSGLNNPTREIKGRDVIFVSRKTGLGMYLQRCKKLLVDEGLNHITLHALSPAIPQAILVLHALLDILPYPRQYVSYELRTGTVECQDEMLGSSGVSFNEKGELVQEDPAVGVMEESEGGLRSRSISSLEIIIRVGKDAHTDQDRANARKARKSTTARPNKAQREARKRAAAMVGAEEEGAGDDVIVEEGGGDCGVAGGGAMEIDEEEMMNAGDDVMNAGKEPKDKTEKERKRDNGRVGLEAGGGENGPKQGKDKKKKQKAREGKPAAQAGSGAKIRG